MSETRQEYIKNIISKNSDKTHAEIELICQKIYTIGKEIGFIGNSLSNNTLKNEQRKHKYDVWIAKEAKKNINILDDIPKLKLITDWTISTRADLFKYDYNQAINEQKLWHEGFLNKSKLEKVKIQSVDENRIVFRFSDNKHFLYLLNENDLEYEGFEMGNCVGDKKGPYKNKVKNMISLILSLRDHKNKPHVTIEIDVESCSISQQYGKINDPPINKYKKMLKEFVLYASDFPVLHDKETLKFLNLIA